MAAVLVLVVLSIGLAMAYGVMRMQATAEQVQRNSIHRGDARQAALAGMSIGLRKMHETGWPGVGSTVSGSLNATDRYVVAYTAGDPNLTTNPSLVTDADVAANPELLYYPYRVTVLAKGFSRNPSTGSEATHAVRAVVELSPGKLANPPANWDKATNSTSNYSVYQRDNDYFSIHMPVQLRGRVRMHGQLSINSDYTNWGDAANFYLSGLKDIFTGQGIDHRPFTGPIVWKLSRQQSTIIGWLQTRLSLTTLDATDDLLGEWRTLAPNSTYQLYPGGPTYDVTPVPTNLGVATVPDVRPLENPLRILYGGDETRLGDNVSLRGTLVVDGFNGVTIDGVGVSLEPLDLPKLDGQSAAVRLPTVVARHLTQGTGKRGAIRGLVNVDEEFRLEADTQAATFTLEGKLLAVRIRIRERTEWDAPNWKSLLSIFSLLGLLDALLPPWAQSNYNAAHEPKVILRPDADPAAIKYHWITRGTPLYQEASPGSGLRWNVVSWKDNP